jgi:uracil-DNA glycosylase
LCVITHNTKQLTRTLLNVLNEWLDFITQHTGQSYFRDLRHFVNSERARYVVHPDEHLEFAALHLTPLKSTRVVILGQDPYHGAGQAHGLAFSVMRPEPPPPSLRNIFIERQNDIGLRPSGHGDLTSWAEHGVLLLNTTLTVRDGHAASHAGRGWETFTDAVISRVDQLDERVVFVLWGRHARQKRHLITQSHHVVLESAHPSPLSAHRGFFGSAPFSRTNRALTEASREPIDWSLPD